MAGILEERIEKPCVGEEGGKGMKMSNGCGWLQEEVRATGLGFLGVGGFGFFFLGGGVFLLGKKMGGGFQKETRA